MPDEALLRFIARLETHPEPLFGLTLDINRTGTTREAMQATPEDWAVSLRDLGRVASQQEFGVNRFWQHPKAVAAAWISLYSLFFMAILIIALPLTFPTRHLRGLLARAAAQQGYPLVIEDLRLGLLGGVDVLGGSHDPARQSRRAG